MLAQRIRARRKALDISQKRLAELSGIAQSSISRYEKGDDDIKTMRNAYNQRRRFLLDAFKKMGLECFEPYGAFYVFPSIKELVGLLFTNH